jgi:hypothetical protein
MRALVLLPLALVPSMATTMLLEFKEFLEIAFKRQTEENRELLRGAHAPRVSWLAPSPTTSLIQGKHSAGAPNATREARVLPEISSLPPLNSIHFS